MGVNGIMRSIGRGSMGEVNRVQIYFLNHFVRWPQYLAHLHGRRESGINIGEGQRLIRLTGPPAARQESERPNADTHPETAAIRTCHFLDVARSALGPAPQRLEHFMS